MEKITLNISQLKTLHGAQITNQALHLMRSIITEKDPQAEALLKNFILKENINPFLLAGFISNLNAFPNRDTELMLVKLLADPTPVIRANAAITLMQVGSPEILPQIERQASNDEQISFVHTVIAHRFGLSATKMKLPRIGDLPVSSGATKTISSLPMNAELQRQMTASTVTGDIRLGSFSSTATQILCGGSPSALVLHVAAAAGGIASQLKSKTSVIGTILRQSEETKTWAFSRMVLGGPLDAGRFYLGIYRRDGRPVLFGTGAQSDNQVTLNAINFPGAVPTTVKVSWEKAAVTISGAAAGKRLQPKTPVAVR